MDNTMKTTEEKVKDLLAAIEDEKKSGAPDRRYMRKLFNQIVELKDDYRVTNTGQENKWQSHTSTRDFDEDRERYG